MRALHLARSRVVGTRPPPPSASALVLPPPPSPSPWYFSIFVVAGEGVSGK